MSQQAIDAALLEENKLRCDPPLPEAEVRGIAASVSRYAPGAPTPKGQSEPSGANGSNTGTGSTGGTPLQNAIRQAVLNPDSPSFDKKREIRDLVRQELLAASTGSLCQTADGRGFYFDKSKRRLFDLEQRPFQHLLSHVSGLSATETQFRFVLDSLQSDAAQKNPVNVHTLSFYDLQTSRLVVSDGGGGIWYRERASEWVSGYNGDSGILFLTEPDAHPWVPEFHKSGALAWFLERFSLDGGAGLAREQQKTLLLVYKLQQFFPALRRTRVVPACLGPQGSGKTSAMRMFGALFCGPDFDVTGLSANREDAFVAAVSNRVMVGLDNADSRIPWLEDALATYATGLRYRLRRLYTTNEEVSYCPRAILLLSSRDPHFRRPDVAERLLPLHFKRPEAYMPESVLFGELVKRRGQIMGELLDRVGHVADSLAGITLPALTFRMADFASFGWAVARAAGQEAEWKEILEKLERSQMEFAAEGDSLVTILRPILEGEGVIGPLDSGELYKRCAKLAEAESLPFPRSPQAFGKHVTNMRRVIEIELEATFTEERLGWKRFITIRRRGS
jgi:hypothetical protein